MPWRWSRMVNTLLKWSIKNVVVCHGELVLNHGSMKLRKAFGYLPGVESTFDSDYGDLRYFCNYKRMMVERGEYEPQTPSEARAIDNVEEWKMGPAYYALLNKKAN